MICVPNNSTNAEMKKESNHIYYHITAWTLDSTEEYIYAAAHNQSKKASIFLKINASTLKVEDSLPLLVPAIDITFRDDKVYLSSSTIYDTKLQNFIGNINKASYTFDLYKNNDEDKIIYVGNTKRVLEWHLVERIYQYDYHDQEASVFKAPNAEWSDWSNFSRPDIQADADNNRIFIAETDYYNEKPRLYAVDAQTYQIVDQTRFINDLKGMSSGIFLNEDTIMYGNHLFDANDLSNVIGTIEDTEIEFANEYYIISRDHVYDRKSLKKLKSLSRSVVNPLVDGDDNLYYPKYHGMGESVTIIKIPLNVSKFDDVKSYTKEINALTRQGIINGYPNETFKPTDSIKRLHAVSMIVREMGIDTSKNIIDPNFKDLKPGEYGYNEIAKAVELGIVSGKKDGTFDKWGNLSRAQMAKILVEAYALKGDNNPDFKDIPSNFWAKDYINTLAFNGITTGYSDNTFQPNEKISRQHFAVFMYRLLKLKDIKDDEQHLQFTEELKVANSGYINQYNANNYTFTGSGTPGAKILLSKIEEENGTIHTFDRPNTFVDDTGAFTVTENLSHISDGQVAFTFATLDHSWDKRGEVTITLMKDTKVRSGSVTLPLYVNLNNETAFPIKVEYVDPYVNLTVEVLQDGLIQTHHLQANENGVVETFLNLSQFKDSSISITHSYTDVAGNKTQQETFIRKDTIAPDKPMIKQINEITDENVHYRSYHLTHLNGTVNESSYIRNIHYSITDGEKTLTDYKATIEGMFALKFEDVQQLNNGKLTGYIYTQDYAENQSEQVPFEIYKNVTSE